MELKKELNKSINLLDNWISRNGWAGWDPFDIQCKFFLHKLSPYSRLMKFAHAYVFKTANRHFPIPARKILRIKPRINAKAMGLFIAAYCNLYRLRKKDNYFKRALKIANWLLENPNHKYSNLCWGYPFDWQSKIFIPEGTPSSVVTSAVGRGFWSLYEVTKNQKFLDVCESICQFFLTSLNKAKTSKGVCFSYTPIDDFQVHNANLFVAEFLIRVGDKLNRNNWISEGLKAVNFSLAEQNPDGSLCYWSKNQKEKYNINCSQDNYHSGFEIRMLYNIWRITNKDFIKRAIDSYYHFYLQNYFAKDYAPILEPKGKYLIDIHSCSETLLCNARLTEHYYNKSIKILKESGSWIINKMQTTEGWFRYRLFRKNQKEITIDIPYLRWGQAWMLLGLSEALKIISNKSDITGE